MTLTVKDQVTLDRCREVFATGGHVHTGPWWYGTLGSGTVIGGCQDPQCCDWEYDTVEEWWYWTQDDEQPVYLHPKAIPPASESSPLPIEQPRLETTPS